MYILRHPAADLRFRAHQQAASLQALGELKVEEQRGLDARHEAQEAEEEEEPEQQIAHQVVERPADGLTPPASAARAVLAPPWHTELALQSESFNLISPGPYHTTKRGYLDNDA